MPRSMPAAMTAKQCSTEIAALEEHQKELSQQNHLEQAKTKSSSNSDFSGRQLSQPGSGRNVCGVQPIHIISSDDEEAIDAAYSSYSGQQGFAGFASPGSNVLYVTPVTSSRSLRQRHAALPKESNSGGLGLAKRSSLNSRKSAGSVNAVEYDKVIPIKRKKDQCNKGVEGVRSAEPLAAGGVQIPPNMQTPPPDQVVEVSSNSTTHSQRQQRLQRRCAQQPNLQHMQNTKCSTETSSEFPVSSPSNPQPGGSKFPQRPPLLKNTLPGDSFERQLAIVAARNPQMTLADKMHAWKCETELSDVEDVNEFDARFQTAEEKKRKMSKCIKNKEPQVDDYDFQHFRYVVLKNLKSQMNMSQQHEDERDKPSTSAAAAAQLRRQDVKKTRPPKEQTQQKKKTQSSTTPAPASSSASASMSASSHGSSDYLGADNSSYGRKKNTKICAPPKLQLYDEVLCPSSSTDASMHVACMSLKPSATGTTATTTLKEASIQSPQKKANLNAFSADDAGTNAQMSSTPLNLHWTSTEEESVFRLNRLNREIDKTRDETSNKTEPKRLIQMHLDFMAEKKKLNLREKKGELFKTPVVPTKYSPNSLHNQLQENQHNHSINNNSSNSNNKNNSNCNINSNINNYNNRSNNNSKSNDIDIHDSTYPSFISPSGSSDAYDFTKSAKDLVELSLPPSPTAEQHQGMHQQHEFCSYLGLTGMSTANAVANAVAELARSNIARRSLRVRRQQHVQDKQEKNCREQKQLEALKLKQLREIKRRDRPIKSSLDEIENHIEKVEGGESMIDSKSYEQKIANKNVLLNNIQTLAQAVPQTLSPIKESKKEPEIKIICHIAADDQSEVQKLSKKYVKKITDPIRNSLIRQINQGNSTTGVITTPPATAAVCPKLLVDTANEVVKKENIVAEISEPIKGESSSSLPTDPVNSVIQIKQEHKGSQCQIDGSERSHIAESETKIEELLLANTQEKLHMRFQEYLEASRRAKPSIYIVQAIDNDKDIKKKIILTELLKGDNKVESTLDSIKYETVTPETKDFSSMDNMKLDPRLSGGAVDTKRKSKKHLSKLLTRSVLNMSQQRQLRNRKIVILKTIKRKTLKSRSKEKKLKKSKQSLQNKESALHLSKLELKKSTTARRRHTAIINKHANANDIGNESADSRHVTILYEQNAKLKESTVELKPIEHELVVVSSTTNCYDEHGTKERSNNTPESVASQRTFVLDDNIVYTKESATQCAPAQTNGICQLTPPSSPMRNPLKAAQGKVLHIYFELDVLIVVQEMLLSFWKYSKLLIVLNVQTPMTTTSSAPSPQQSKQLNHQQQRQQQREAETNSPPLEALGEWLHLGECKRLQYDVEISTPYANRICIHNSIPIYIEMRCKELQKERRDCNLLSLYINIYFYNDEEMHAKMHSIQLDAVQSLPLNVIYTTITDSRYFVMSWPQENILGKIRSGLCKYSLTPHLDTLASIREFKSMRHEIRYLECTEDDKLLGFGVTQLTVWDHRSGDVLMNYDLGLNLGRNLGSIYYPSLEIGQNSMILLFQLLPYIKETVDNEQNDVAKCISHSEVHVIICSISHVTPSHRVLYRHPLPSPTFIHLSNAINTGEHMLLTAPTDEEIWISCGDPKMMTLIPAQQSQRFYVRGRSQLIELTERTLSVDCFANHVLKISAATV